MNLRTIRALNSWPLRIEPAHSRVWEGACLLWRNPINWLRTYCGRNAAEWRKLKSVLCGCRAIYTARCSHHQSLRNCSTHLRSLPVSAIAVRVADIHIYIHSKISNRTRSLASLRSLTLAARQLAEETTLSLVRTSLLRCSFDSTPSTVLRQQGFAGATVIG